MLLLCKIIIILQVKNRVETKIAFLTFANMRNSTELHKTSQYLFFAKIFVFANIFAEISHKISWKWKLLWDFRDDEHFPENRKFSQKTEIYKTPSWRNHFYIWWDRTPGRRQLIQDSLDRTARDRTSKDMTSGQDSLGRTTWTVKSDHVGRKGWPERSAGSYHWTRQKR